MNDLVAAGPNPVTPVDSPKSYSVGGKIMLCAIIILFAVVLTVLCLHIYARWYLRRRAERRRRERGLLIFTAEHQRGAPTANLGLDPVVLKSIPVFNYLASDFEEDAVVDCAVCLNEFQENEKGRTLPGCKHSFHIECIDMWFCSHSTCPLCRSSVESAAKESVCVDIEAAKASDLCDSCRREDGMAASSSSSSSSSSPTPVSPRLGRSEVRMEEELKSPVGRILLLMSILSRDSRLHRAAATVDLERGGQEEEGAATTPRTHQPEP